MDSYRSYVTENDTVLEIGASITGRTRELSKQCSRVIGVELLPERIPEPVDNVTYLQGDWQEVSRVIDASTIDVAVSSHVIEHVRDDLKAINELHEVLKPGGVALLNTPNRKRLPRAMLEFVTKDREFPWWEHQREYIEKDLEKLLEASLFESYQIRPVAFGLHGGPFFLYTDKVPKRLRKYANYWEIHLFKAS